MDEEADPTLYPAEQPLGPPTEPSINQMLLVAYTCLTDVFAGVEKCL